ncbi:hypothetical protein LDG_7014 [Legionella drancourtii LLAP12]|uniref:Uncharacterized protein n=1 Tax=Legionella drancourtii LLAP12 TaxID=658187 RepID=G9EP33_9GAMM|nr:hypothetical protein LDG_7014 [Legionella drancourtii LLAP12]
MPVQMTYCAKRENGFYKYFNSNQNTSKKPDPKHAMLARSSPFLKLYKVNYENFHFGIKKFQQ